MKRITLFLTVCLGLSVFQTVFAVDTETARAANKRGSANTFTTNTSSTRTMTSASKQKSDSNRVENSRATTNRNVRNSTTVQNRSAKKTSIVKQRPNTQTTNLKTVTTRSNGLSRSNVQTRSTTARKNLTPKSAATRSAVNQIKTNRIARAAALDTEKIEEIKSKDYSKCKDVYFDCMDEFCANKDANLRRCACSTRIHEFDNIKKQLGDVEEQMMGFNRRLLTVGMDKEDAIAINTATEGETAYSQQDKSESEKILERITSSLNDSKDSKIANDLSAISLDLDMESAWDSVDSLGGASTTAKSGLALYNAAQPVCIAMAKEVCSADEIDVVQNSYNLSIQNDCNTVAKAYNSQYNQTINKIHESSALLDMARLNAYQQRNSDDVLTCRKKMLDQLSDESVCGKDLYKCLDISGQYIDPSTGDAFLSTNLANLANLLTRPTGKTKWTTLSNNKEFVNFLDSKKAFLETATEQCQDIANDIWSDFLEDALAQIKLAQNAKLEEIRRSCLTLIAECKANAIKELEDFDSRALSTFAIAADTTANGMCEETQQTCIGLMDNTEWTEGIAGLTADISAEKTLENCMTIGKTCIMQKCNGPSGNFALCDSSDEETRRNILNRNVCWDDVFDCVKQSGHIATMIENINYNDNISNSYFNCDNTNLSDSEKQICKISHKIWGRCDNDVEDSTSEIISNEDTLLNWFASQTNEDCHVSRCQAGYEQDHCGVCEPMIEPEFVHGITTNNTKVNKEYTINLPEGVARTLAALGGIHFQPNTNLNFSEIYAYCPGGCSAKDFFGNCCGDGYQVDSDTKVCVKTDTWKAVPVQTVNCTTQDATDARFSYYCEPDYYTTNCEETSRPKTLTLYCVTTDTATYPKLTNPTNAESYIECGSDASNGYWMIVDDFGNYYNPAKQDETGLFIPILSIETTINWDANGHSYSATYYETTLNNMGYKIGSNTGHFVYVKDMPAGYNCLPGCRSAYGWGILVQDTQTWIRPVLSSGCPADRLRVGPLKGSTADKFTIF